MILCSVLYCLLTGAEGEKFWVIILMCLLKMVEALADVYEGYMQQIGHLDVAGKNVFTRTVLFSVVFAAVLYISKNLVFASAMAVITSAAMLVIFNIIPVYQCEKFELRIGKEAFRGISKECFSLFIAMFLTMYLVNAPKYAIDGYMTAEYQTYYNILYTPAQVINLLSEFAFKPLLTELAKFWEDNQIKDLAKYIFKFFIYILGITLLCLGVAYILGIPVLSFVYGVNLDSFKTALLAILVGGGFNAMVNMLYCILTTMRMQKSILVSYIGIAVVVLIIPKYFVIKMGLTGAVYSYIFLMGTLAVWLTISMIKCIHKNLEMKL